MDLEQRIAEIKPQQLNCNVFSVYDYCGVTVQELLSQFFEKINDCIKVSNQTVELASWLVNEGLEIEVAKKLELWLIDGTLGKIINEILLKELEDRVTTNESDIEDLKDVTDRHDITIKRNTDDIADHELRLKELERDEGVNEELPVYTVHTQGKSTMEMVNSLNKDSRENNAKNILRVGSFNVNSFRTRDTYLTSRVGYEILKAQLDICCIQEFAKYHTFNSEWWIKIPKAYDNVAYNPLQQLYTGGGTGGQGLLSHIPMSNTVNGKYSEVANYENRGYMRTTVNINNNQVNIYNTHLTHDNMSMLRSEMSQLAQVIRNDSSKYKIICGDFNTYTESDYQPLTSLGFKFAIPLSTRTIDNVLVQDNVRLIQVNKIPVPENLSDHAMVVTEMELI